MSLLTSLFKGKHKVRTYSWVNGKLRVRDNYFASEEEATEFGENGKHYMVKIFNTRGLLVRTIQHLQGAGNPVAENTYA